MFFWLALSVDNSKEYELEAATAINPASSTKFPSISGRTSKLKLVCLFAASNFFVIKPLSNSEAWLEILFAPDATLKLEELVIFI